MYTVRAEPRHKIAIKSAKSLVPGYGAAGEAFGRLVPSSDIVSGIRPRRAPRPGRGDSAAPRPAEDLPGSWLKTLLGFDSIATTHATQSAAEEAIASGFEWSTAAAELRKPLGNDDIQAMTTLAIESALQEYERRRNRPCDRARSILGHIHIAATSSVRTPYALLESRRATRCDRAGMPIVSLLSGCSGLLFALQQARFLLDDERGASDDGAFVLLSCSNDLLPFAHTRGRSPDGRNEDIDAWLFQAIFGEGAGAIVVGRADPEGGDWVIEDLGWETVADDWRVTMVSEAEAPSMVIRAREVGMTFRAHVPPRGEEGARGPRRAGLSRAASPLRSRVEPEPGRPRGVDAEGPRRRPQHQREGRDARGRVGVLAPRRGPPDARRRRDGIRDGARDGIVCALIGETGNAVVAGHIALRFARGGG